MLTASTYTADEIDERLTTATSTSLQRSANLSDVASPAVARSNLGLGTASTAAASSFEPAGTAQALISSINVPTLAPVATSGAYADLTGKPTIPDVSSIVSATVSGTPSNPVTSASATRPTGLPVVYWMCATQPTNWLPNDVWINNS